MSKTYTIYQGHVNLRQIKCSCNDPKCQIGISFDSNPDVLRFHDKYCNEHSMELSRENIKYLIQELKDRL